MSLGKNLTNEEVGKRAAIEKLISKKSDRPKLKEHSDMFAHWYKNGKAAMGYKSRSGNISYIPIYPEYLE